jgi:lactate permease
MDLTVGNWLLACLPVLLLMGSILFLRWEAPKAGAGAWFVSLAVAWGGFGADARLLALANSKGVSLSIFVLLIIWGAVFLYTVAAKAGAIKVIGNTLMKVTDDRLLRCLLFAWCFTSVLQGLAGFGVPVAVVAPIMVIMGYTPLTAVAACLVGHSWAITFGSMGSSYIAIQLVTGLPGEVIGPVMALLFSIAVFTTGFGVAHIYGGMAAVKRAASIIFPAGAVMSATLWLANIIGTAQLASLLAAMAGCIVLGAGAYLRTKKAGETAGDAPAPALNPQEAEGTKGQDVAVMSFNTVSFPYYLLIALSITAQIPPVKTALKNLYFGLDYPAVQTALGYMVKAETGYAKILLFSHPAPMLFFAALAGYCVYVKAGNVNRAILAEAARETVKKCIPTSVGILLMVMMALVMIDSGMTTHIARGIAGMLRAYYGLLAPVVGVLGTFITGSNTNSNIMFGALQYETALLLGKSGTLFAAAQSLGGSIGVAISPSTIMTGASNVGLNGQESAIMRVTAKYCLFSVVMTGIAVWILS